MIVLGRNSKPIPQYIALSILFACAAIHEGCEAFYVLRAAARPSETGTRGFEVEWGTRTIGAGRLRQNQLLAIDGQPFTRGAQWLQYRPAGAKVRLTLREPSGRIFETTFEVPSLASQARPLSRVVFEIALNIVAPLIALGLGFAAAAIRPRDPNAWILLFLLISFTEIARFYPAYMPWSPTRFLWREQWQQMWGIWMFLFGIYFPSRLPLDRRRPWIKYLLIISAACAQIATTAIELLWTQDVAASLPFRPLLAGLYWADQILNIILIGCFFAFLGYKSATEASPDGRRRLRILHCGASVSLTPVFLAVLYAMVRGREIGDAVGWPLMVIALAALALFPLALAYVIVVERAMDLKFVIRQSVRYGVARGGLWLIRAALVAAAIYLFSVAAGRGSNRAADAFALSAVAVGLIVLRRRAADQASEWLDRQFFREAYDAEKVLSELAAEVIRYIETEPLLNTVAQRISCTLHVPDVCMLLREGDVFRTRHSTRAGEPLEIHASGRLAQLLREREAPLEIHFDRPPEWLPSLASQDLQALQLMGTQLLLALPGHKELVGIVSLGLKLSELPYSETDKRLLRAVAAQMGLALENSRFSAMLAAEAAQRERIRRELEIAREVQERLFPQRWPSAPGLDCAAYCRPARGVGGDYYDFLQIAGGRIGIAVGDVAGKGIAAALLMASLQASLRGQAVAGVHDLSALMRNVNRLVYEASTSNRYATFFYGEYDPAALRLSYVNAGHNPPGLLRGAEAIRLEGGGPVVGLFPETCYEQQACNLMPGDILIAYTDGLSEAMNERGEEFGEDRLFAAAQACVARSAREMIEQVVRAADAFVGAADQHDDMTLLIVKIG